jgi:hypothetical protein
MKIYFERSGGFVGRNVCTVVDTDEIPPEKALKLLEIVEDVDFFSLPETTPEDEVDYPSSVDHLNYRITVEVAGVQHTVETSDTSLPPRLQQLIRELSRWERERSVERSGASSGNSSF